MAEEIKSMEWVDPADGQKYLIVKPGGAETRNNESAGAIKIIEGKPNITPSDYTGFLDLTAAGQGFQIADGASQIHVGVVTAAAGLVLIAFGTSELDAEGNCVGGTTTSSLLGTPICGKAVDSMGTVDIPNDSTITHFALAEAHDTPTGEVMITQG